jgi:hypothetical protein
VSAFRVAALAPPAIFTSLPVRRSGPKPALASVESPRPVDAFQPTVASRRPTPALLPAHQPIVEASLALDGPVSEAAATINTVAAKLRSESTRLRAAQPGIRPAELNAQLGAFVGRLPAGEHAALTRAMDAQRSPEGRDQFWAVMRDPVFARKYFEVNAAFLRSRNGP